MPKFTFSPKAGRYRNVTTGRWVSDQQVLDGVEALVSLSSDTMTELSQQLRSGSISLEAFQTQFYAAIKQVNVAAALAGYGGREAMTPSRWGAVGQQIRAQYGYARTFVGQIVDGTQPMDARLDRRARMYSANGRVTFQDARRRQQGDVGAQWEKNVLNARESCAGCKDQDKRGWVPFGELVPPGRRTCLSNCLCTVTFRVQKPAEASAA